METVFFISPIYRNNQCVYRYTPLTTKNIITITIALHESAKHGRQNYE